MRKMFLLALAAVGMTAGTASAQSTGTKIGFINSQKIIAEAPGAAEVRTTIEREMNKHRADLSLADDSLKKMITEYEKKQLVLSADARKKEEDAIRARQQALQTRAQSLEDQMAKRQNDLAKPIMEKINTVLQEIRKEGGYVLILDAAAGGIVSADPAADLTDTVLTRLKSTAAAGAPAAAKKP
ncbi:MAG TPA: OmpH family outer membrane protein [Longimicrobiales bacterium]